MSWHEPKIITVKTCSAVSPQKFPDKENISGGPSIGPGFSSHSWLRLRPVNCRQELYWGWQDSDIRWRDAGLASVRNIEFYANHPQSDYQMTWTWSLWAASLSSLCPLTVSRQGSMKGGSLMTSSCIMMPGRWNVNNGSTYITRVNM